ncbi:MAG: hypothetical protein U9R27_00660 [Campylobacterota bacterium]|nr:hypothetical protein [Campylobacterota bacterium]
MTKFILVLVYIVVFNIDSLAKERGFDNLNFAVSIDYSSRAMNKLKKSGEKVKVWVVIDQYGKRYMEEEAVADTEIIINPGEKAVFHGVPLRQSNYRYKKHKRYILTVMVVSARKKYSNNILNCYSRSGEVDYDTSRLAGEVLKFECKLNQ